MPIQVERATRSLTLYDITIERPVMDSLLPMVISYPKAPIVASFLTWIMKLPDF